MIRSAALLALSVGWASAHPLCYTNDRPTDTEKTELIFCPAEQFGGEDFLQYGSCCTDLEEGVVETKFLEAGPLTPECSVLYKELLCTQCHSFSAHIFERIGAEYGPWDGMTLKREFCDEFVEQCAGQIALGGPAEYNGLSYCDQHVGGVDGNDQFWSYPYTDPPGGSTDLAEFLPDVTLPTQVVSMRQTPDGSQFWIVGLIGQVRMVEASNLDVITDVMDIRGNPLFYRLFEEGLLDLAHDPKWTENNFFYLSFTVNLGSSEEPITAQNRLSRFTYVVGDTSATLNSEVVLVTSAPKATSIHSAGWLGFKPSAYASPGDWNELFWTTGDGGPQTDPNGESQDVTNLLGAIMRISVPSFDGAADLYEIPPGNYQDVDSDAAPEVCAIGLRNPWRCSFDRLTDELWCADVGHTRVEEVDIIECGKNYGWSRFEGSYCQAAVEGSGLNGENPPCAGVDRSGFEFPLYQYCHPDYLSNEPDYTGGEDFCGDREIEGHAIIGGFVYRGSYFSDLLFGAYIFTDQVTRNVYFIKQNEEGEWVSGTIISDASAFIISLSEDINGEIYLIGRLQKIYYLPCGDLCSSTCLEQNEEQPTILPQGCFSDSASNRVLTLAAPANCNAGETYMSPEICASYCSTIEGAFYAGVEDGTDCYCGTSSDILTKNGEVLDEESCSTLCESNPESTCGGVDAIEVFEIGPPVPPLTPSPALPVVTLSPAATLAPGAVAVDTCSNGLPGIDGSNANGNVCCPLQCGQCGDVGCSSSGLPTYDNTGCCINGILNNQQDCSVSGAAPCIVTGVLATPTPAAEATPAPSAGAPGGEGTCGNGLPGIDGSNDNGDVCCPLECGQCGGVGCGSSGLPTYGNTGCCINGILNNQQDCSVSGAAPCIVTGALPTPTPVGAAPTPAPVAPGTDPTCSNGIPGYQASNEVGAACCPLECGQCGGFGCHTFGLPTYDNTGCCINGILNNQQDCSVSGAAPCIVTGDFGTPAPGATPSPVPAITIEGYLGCFVDDRNVRILSTLQEVSLTSMTAEFCKAACDGAGFDYYGTQYEVECWCGSGTPEETYNLYGQVSDSLCDAACSGDSSEACGGFLRMSVYTFTP